MRCAPFWYLRSTTKPSIHGCRWSSKNSGRSCGVRVRVRVGVRVGVGVRVRVRVRGRGRVIELGQVLRAQVVEERDDRGDAAEQRLTRRGVGDGEGQVGHRLG